VNSRPRLLLASVVIVLLAVVVLGIPAAALASPSKGTGGWYWPTGTEKLGSMDGYWVYRPSNHSWHMAKDIATPQGHPVYAIADGVVAESKGDAGYGGVLVVWHKTGDGQKFLAVYGHINRKKLGKGAKVKAGQVIGKINSYNHLHFGIHPGSKYPPDRNPYRGHTYTASQTYGWVDPIKFLRTHPAFKVACITPTLPLVTTISTLSTPTVLGVAADSVYWSVPSGESSTTTFTCTLPSGEATPLADDAELPELDTTRYLATTSTASFALYDRMPVLTASYSTKRPAWKHDITVSGTLKNFGGKAFAGAKICLERSYDGTKWLAAASTTSGQKGAYSLGLAPSRSCQLRVRFTPANTYLPTTSTPVAVTPKPGLHAPDSAKQSKTGRSVTVGGKLDARHPTGAHTVTLRLQRLGSKGWTDVVTTWAVNANSGSGTRYSRKLTLAAGTWRVGASCAADSLHAAEKTGWTKCKVK
jgi:murein DD-endopeptidase MepM/ murein hydrolase activator NlpD